MASPSKKTDLDIALLRKRMDYDPTTGILTWRDGGKVAGFVGNRGYLRVKFQRREWLAHVLAWAWAFGHVPKLQLDHINRVKTDNRLCNLRVVTPAQNMANRDVPKCTGPDGSPLPAGVQFNRLERKFKVTLRRNGRRLHLGTYPTANEAVQALREAIREVA